MDIENQFLIGFNSGYLIAKHEPTLSSKIIKSLHSTAGYLEGFFSGTEEYELENKIVSMFRLRNNLKSRDQELEKE